MKNKVLNIVNETREWVLHISVIVFPILVLCVVGAEPENFDEESLARWENGNPWVMLTPMFITGGLAALILLYKHFFVKK